jgi:hypothetical protein
MRAAQRMHVLEMWSNQAARARPSHSLPRSANKPLHLALRLLHEGQKAAQSPFQACQLASAENDFELLAFSDFDLKAVLRLFV